MGNLDFTQELSNVIITIDKESTHSKVDAPEMVVAYLSVRGAHSGCRRGGHYFLRLFFLSLSRKVSNATIKLPKEISRANIPIMTIIVSKAVICATSLLM